MLSACNRSAALPPRRIRNQSASRTLTDSTTPDRLPAAHDSRLLSITRGEVEQFGSGTWAVIGLSRRKPRVLGMAAAVGAVSVAGESPNLSCERGPKPRQPRFDGWRQPLTKPEVGAANPYETATERRAAHFVGNGQNLVWRKRMR